MNVSITVFYSWQTDSPSTMNRNFIENALKRAIRKLKADAEVVNSMRGHDMVLDKDTKGLPGTPPIVQAIFDKIDNCAVFVPDLTFVAKTLEDRSVPNPNVLIEYGWALKSRGVARMVPVMNTAFGEPSWESLPFNMRHLKWPLTYELAEGAERSEVRKKLVGDLADAIRAVVEGDPAEASISAPEFEGTLPTVDKAVFFQQDERLASNQKKRWSSEDISFPTVGAKMFLRLIPTAPMEPLTTTQAHDLATRHQVRVQPFSFPVTTGFAWSDRNQYGAIVYRDDGKGTVVEHLTEILKNRELWGVNSEPETWRHAEGGFGFLYNGYEAAFAAALKNYLQFAQDELELQSPLRLIAGFTGIEGFRMTAPPGQSFLGYERHRGRAVEPDIIWEGVVDGWDTPPEMILMPFFQKVWHDMGLGERPDVPN